jgi:hypothetical protein
MKKLKLRLSDLRVESFGTDAHKAAHGTVAGNQSGFITCPGTCDTCPPCGPTQAHTCEGYTCTENLPHCYA